MRVATILVVAMIATPLVAQDDLPATPSSAAWSRDNVVILLDASGSMNDMMSGSADSRMEVAKEALAKVVDRIAPNTNVGLLVFSDIPGSSGWLYDLAPLDRARLLEAIDRCQASGGTPLGEYVKIAADRLLEARQAQRGYGTFRLLVVTDGEATDPEVLRRYLPDVLARGVVVDCIGVDMQDDHALARQVRSYRRANDPAALEEAVAQSLGEVGAAGADDASREQYELAAALNEEIAVAVLDSLTTPVNAPIGERAAADASIPEFADNDQPNYYGQQGGSGSFGNVLGGICTCLFVIVVLFLVAVAAVAKAAGRNRRRR